MSNKSHPASRSNREDNVSNDSMNCGQVKRLLPPFLDEELSGRVREQIASHLASCPACRAELEALRADMGLLEQVGAPEVSSFLVTRVMAEVRERRRTAPHGFARLVGSLAAGLVVAVSIGAGVLFGSGLARTSTPVAENSTEAAVSYVESSSADMYAMLAGGD
jgi:anti-sigma factor RsiW